MPNIISICFGDTGKHYCFDAEGHDVKKGDLVVVESEIGISIGQIKRVGCAAPDSSRPIKPILRKVTEVDIKQQEENEGVRKEAFDFCTERIMARGLPMKLVDAEVTLDRKRFLFYFTADNRIDFRELVKDLASKYRTRIELRQIGVRDAARMVGGYGICGREFCCKAFLDEFAPISIKMAKQQGLVLNTCKLSGSCGRLLCCLNYEYHGEKPRRKHAATADESEDVKALRELEEELYKESQTDEGRHNKPLSSALGGESDSEEDAASAKTEPSGEGGQSGGTGAMDATSEDIEADEGDSEENEADAGQSASPADTPPAQAAQPQEGQKQDAAGWHHKKRKRRRRFRRPGGPNRPGGQGGGGQGGAQNPQ